jgi:PAS domain S-box-containing protein
VAYLTLDRDGRIVEANLTAAAEFEMDRSSLLSRHFVQFVAMPDADRWQRVAERAFRRKELMRTELLLLRADGTDFQAELDCRRVMRLDARAQLRVTLTDASQRRLAERNRRIAAGASTARDVERRALALGLHEGLGQQLAALKLHLGALALPKDATDNQTMVAAMAAELDEAMNLVRQMSTDLHPLMLEDLGLGAALDWLTRDIAVRLGLRTELHIDEDTAGVDEALAIPIYRLTELALTHFAQFVVAGISIELVQRPRDLVLLFQSVPGHVRSEAPLRPMMVLPEAFKDQIHLLGGRLMFSELPGDIRRVGVSLEVQPGKPKGPRPSDGLA